MIYVDVTDSCKSPMNTGIQRVVRGLFRALCDAQNSVTPVLWEPGLESYCALSKRERGFLESPFATHGGKALSQPSRSANPIPLWSKLARRLTHRRNRIDLAARLTSSDCFFVPQIFRDDRGKRVTELCGKTGARSIAFFYDAIPWRRPDVTPAANVVGVLEYMAALAEFDLVITSSREATDDLRACWKIQGLTETPPLHILGWPPDETFSAKPTMFLQVGDKRKVILCVGTLEPRKNHLTLLAAAEQLWRDRALDFELEFIGRTTRECGPRVLAEVERLQQTGRAVHWRRHVDNNSLLAAYDKCSFTVFPSFIEGYGLPIIESLQRGRPCVCGGNGALGELANGGGCLIVDQTNAKALAEGMRRLLTDESLYLKLSAEARDRKFENWQDYVAKLLNHIEAKNQR